MFGYHGRFLHVDLHSGTGAWRSLDETVLRRFLGGSGLGAHLLLGHDPAADPLAPEAPLVFVFSPLVGSPLTTSAKFAVVGKSPLTGRFNDSLASSGFALAGKRTGADAIVITGRAPAPSVLLLDGDRIRLEPAADLWGLSCAETQRRLRGQLPSDYQFAVIGQAGERLVRYATISHDGRHAGRGGNGAVLGAKQIKAIAVRGDCRVEWASPDALHAYAKRLSKKSLGPATAKYRELGTAANLLVFNRLHSLPTHNFQQGSFAAAAALSPEALATVRNKTNASCAACTIGCEHIYSVRSQDNAPSAGVRVEYENLFALGPLCGVSDSETVLRASQRCDELGLDTISTGGSIAFGMECVQRGLLDAPWLTFGSPPALLRAIELIAQREGLGDMLAEGSRLMAESLGHNSIEFAPQVKGLEIPGYEPRALQTMGLGFAVGARGADHNRSGAYEADFSEHVDRRRVTSDSARLAIETENQAAVMDSLILCKFLRRVFDDFYGSAAEMLRLVVGWEVDSAELQATAARIVTAKKLFNIRAGWTPQEDTLPRRFFTHPLDDDQQARIDEVRFREAIADYNRQRGWTSDGWLGQETRRELDR